MNRVRHQHRVEGVNARLREQMTPAPAPVDRHAARGHAHAGELLRIKDAPVTRVRAVDGR